MDATKVGGKWTAEEIVNQVRLTRKQAGASGEIFWDMKSLMENRGRLASTLGNDLFAQPALIPDSPWLGKVRPGMPKLNVVNRNGNGPPLLTWQATSTNKVWLWIVQTRKAARWTTEVLPSGKTSYSLNQSFPEVIAVTAVNRSGN